MSPLLSLNISPDGFAFNVTTGESYTLNHCARMVLHRFRSGETQEQIVYAIASEFGIAQSLVERDVADFFQQLHLLGLTGGNS
ncbi:MAG TPA: PqqD family protein [Microcoleaceae cyanobacterium]